MPRSAAQARTIESQVRLVSGAQPVEAIQVHKVASVTRNLVSGSTVQVVRGGMVRSGDLVVVEALEEKRVYDQLELTTGRLAHISKGDVFVGTLGSRRALKGFVGECPESVVAGDELHVLNLGGVIGRVVSSNADFGKPLTVKVLGLAAREGRVLNIAQDAVPPARKLKQRLPLVVVAGTCMASGKTQAACEIVARLTARGRKVGGLKLSGVAAVRDPLNMQDHGAKSALSFLDAGLPSTAGVADLAPMAKGLLNAIADDGVDVVVVEMGDGIIGGYGVQSFYADPQLKAAIAAHVICANDLVAAWGAAQLAAQFGRPVDVMSGPATDTLVGEQYVEQELGIAVANARTNGERLADLVAERIGPVLAR